VDELKTEVGDIKNKVYNGYSENLQQLREITKDLAEAQKDMSELLHEHDKRLQGCEDHDQAEEAQANKHKLQRYRWLTVGVSLLGVLAVILGVFL
jgi:anti-sigma-K factor RskA